MDTILGIFSGESYSSIHALADLSVCIKIYQQCTLHSGSVVAHEGDSYSLIESSVVHLPFVGLAGFSYYRKHTLLVLPLVISLVEY